MSTEEKGEATNIRGDIMGPEHGDIKYLKRDDIGAVMAKGLSETYQANPKNPVEFFAKWLLNYGKTDGASQEATTSRREVAMLKKAHEEDQQKGKAAAEEAARGKELAEQENNDFWAKLDMSEDLNDNLTELANYLQKNLGATGVSVGKLELKMQPIQDDDDDKAHIAEDAPLVIKFKHANGDHEPIMVGAVLAKEQGICHELFGGAGDEEGDGGADDAGDEPAEEGDASDILTSYKHKYVPEVVREPKIHFWRVPRLGSFMAIPLVYKSSLSEEAIDKAVTDWIEVVKQREAQDKERQDYEDEQAQAKEEKLKAGEPWDPEVKQWEEISTAPLITEEQKFVVCIDTLGQDRELTDDQKRFALNTASRFRDAWEKFENDKLVADRDMRIASNRADKEWIAENLDKLKDEEDKYVEEQMNLLETPPTEEDDKAIWQSKFRLQFQAQLFLDEEKLKPRLEEVKEYKVVKYGRFLQGLLYLLGYPKERVVEAGTQKFFWKTAKTLLDEEFVEKLIAFETIGPKQDAFEKYQQLNFIERNIAGIVPGEVDEFNMVLGRLYKWLLAAIENRKLNIVRRRALIQKDRDERDAKIKAREERGKKREQDLADAKVKFEEEHKDEIQTYNDWEKAQAGGGDDYGEEEEEEDGAPKNAEPPALPKFEAEEFLAAWDVETPEVEILGAAGDDIDNDWVLTEEEVEEQIKQFWSARTES